MRFFIIIFYLFPDPDIDVLNMCLFYVPFINFKVFSQRFY